MKVNVIGERIRDKIFYLTLSLFIQKLLIIKKGFINIKFVKEIL